MDGFEHEPPEADDAAMMVNELRGRLDARTLARAIGVERSELDLIAAGYTPSAQAMERLRLLHRIASTTDDLRDPTALLGALGVEAASASSLPFVLMPRLKTYLIAFFVFDALVAVAVVVVFALR